MGTAPWSTDISIFTDCIVDVGNRIDRCQLCPGRLRIWTEGFIGIFTFSLLTTLSSDVDIPRTPGYREELYAHATLLCPDFTYHPSVLSCLMPFWWLSSSHESVRVFLVFNRELTSSAGPLKMARRQKIALLCVASLGCPVIIAVIVNITRVIHTNSSKDVTCKFRSSLYSKSQLQMNYIDWW